MRVRGVRWKGLLRAALGGGLVILALGTGTGCEAPAAADGEGDDAADEEPSPGPPVVIEPLAVAVGAADRQDITVLVADLLPTTRAELDGRSWSLSEPGPVLREGLTLRLPLAGAMVVGEHELSLVHYVGNKELRSDAMTIRVEAAELAPLSASLEPEVVGVGDRLVDSGPGERLLGIVDDGAESIELRLGDWSAPGVVQPLPGLAAAAGLIAGRVDLSLVELEQGRWLITTWLAEGGERVRARVTEVDGDGQLGEPGALLEPWSLADPAQRALLGPHEVAIDHGIALLDRMIVIAVEARRDAETQTPGDRLLVTRWLVADGSLAPTQLIRGPGGRDLDLPGRARLWLDLGPHEPSLSLRLALAFPWLLELAGNGLPVLTGDPGEAADVPGAPSWMASADGALGSRHAFALELDGDQPRVRALRIDRWGEQLLETPTVELVDLPALPSAAPSLALIAGSPTLLIPFGVGTPAWAVRSNGESLELDSLAELGCDAVVLAQSEADGEGESQRVACIVDGELRLGALAVE